jgi:hypothetical protein
MFTVGVAEAVLIGHILSNPLERPMTAVKVATPRQRAVGLRDSNYKDAK